MKTVEYRAQIEQALGTQFQNRELLRPLNYRSLWFFPHVLTTVLAAWAITRTELLAFKLAESLIIGSRSPASDSWVTNSCTVPSSKGVGSVG